MKRCSRISVIVLPLVMLVLGASAGADIPIETFALTGWQAPGADPGVAFSAFHAPTINALGQVLFTSSLAGPGVQSGNDRGFFNR